MTKTTTERTRQHPWTSEQITELMDHMKNSEGKVKDLFDAYAAKHERTGAAVQQRYYMELRKSKPAKKRAAPRIRSLNVTGRGAAPIPIPPRPVATAFNDASISELIAVNKQLMAALESRMSELAKLRTLV